MIEFYTSLDYYEKAVEKFALINDKMKGNEDNLSFSDQAAIVTHYLSLADNAQMREPFLKQGKELLSIWKNASEYAEGSNSEFTLKEPNVHVRDSLFDSIVDSPFPPNKLPKFTFIDLFAGIGGFRMAMQELGGECVFSSEWDVQAQKTYYANYGEVPFGEIGRAHV